MARKVVAALVKKEAGGDVLVMPFRSQEGMTECQPLTATMGRRFHDAATAAAPAHLRFVPSTSDAGGGMVLRGVWSNSGQGEDIVLTARVHEDRSDRAQVVGTATGTMALSLLPSETAACILALAQDDKAYVALKDIPIRAAPSPSAEQVSLFKKGSLIHFETRLRGSPWKIAQLPDAEAVFLPQDLRRGFVYARTDVDIAEENSAAAVEAQKTQTHQ
ncbi:MAG: hypothetical protein HQL34_13880 [Alphaproteobacteria bacterium]|nr:hypothetical protein [Alphaproteobacteria bacterium]